MNDEIHVISDADGLAVVGDKAAVENFLASLGLLSMSKDFTPSRLVFVLGTSAAVAQAGSDIAANSGRYLKLTEESAHLVKKFGLMESKTPGVSHAMLGKPGSINKWLQIQAECGSPLTNPTFLSGAAGIMAQLARQQDMKEFRAYLDKIDTKINQVLRNQRYAKVAEVKGAGHDIESAMKVLEELHRVDDDTWSTVQGRQATITDAQEWALLQLADLAEELESTSKTGVLARTAREAESEVQELLALLGRCLELQDALDVLRLDRMLSSSPADLDVLRTTLTNNRQDRRKSIAKLAQNLMVRMDAAAGTANSNVLLYPRKSRAVVNSVNVVGLAVDDFLGLLKVELGRSSLAATRFWDATKSHGQWANAVKEAGPKVLTAAGVAAAGVWAGNLASRTNEDRDQEL